MSPDDAQLVKRVLSGDEDAFQALVRRHQPLLLQYVFGQLRSLPEAEDIVQESFLRAYYRLEYLRDPARFGGWLFRIAMNLCQSWQRRRQAGERALGHWRETVAQTPRLTSAHLLEGRELSDAIVLAVQALPDNHRQVFTLYLEGVSYQGIADMLELRHSTVSGRVQVAKRHMRRTLERGDLLPVNSGNLQSLKTYLGEEWDRMMHETTLRRRIYSTGSWYHVRWEGCQPEQVFAQRDMVMFLFREIISGRMYPDVFLGNGARVHQSQSLAGNMPIQYSAPECDDWLQLLAQHRAGERILHDLARSASERIRDSRGVEQGELVLFNQVPANPGMVTDMRESYLLSAKIRPGQLAAQLVPFLVSQVIYTGSGYLGSTSDPSTYHISSRAEHIKRVWGRSDEYSHKQPNCYPQDVMLRACRNSHMFRAPDVADERYQRLQICMHDANRADWALLLRVGTTALLLQMLEDGNLSDEYALQDPVAALHTISTDTTCTRKVSLADGREFSAVELQRAYLGLARTHFSTHIPDPTVLELLDRWEFTLSELAEEPGLLDRHLDWIIKRRLLQTTERSGNCLEEQLTRACSYHRLGGRGAFALLERSGQVERLVTDAQIEVAGQQSPQTTRAKFRSKFIRMANDRKILCGVNWSYIQLYGPHQRLYLSTDPLTAEYEDVSEAVAGFENKT